MNYSDLEQEVIVLKAVTDMLQGMVNFSILAPITATADTNIQFASDAHAKLFNILLVDFLSPVTDSPRPFDLPRQPQQGHDKTADTTFLFFLRRIVANPLVGHDTKGLGQAVEDFATWLEGTTDVEGLTLPSIGLLNAPFSIQRMRWLKLCGNTAKHSFARLGKDQENLRDALAANGVTIQQGRVFPALEDFLQHFYRDLYLYHASTLVEFLNNIRWAIYDYLKLPHLISESEMVIGDFKFPTYDPPPGVTNELTKEMWWSMMWQHQRKPYVPRFTVTATMKRRT